MNNAEPQTGRGTVSFDLAKDATLKDATLIVRFSGRWHLDKNLPPTTEVIRALDTKPAPKRVLFDTANLANWDSGLLSFLTETDELCRTRGIVADRSGLPTGLRRLLDLAEAVPEKKGTQTEPKREFDA